MGNHFLGPVTRRIGEIVSKTAQIVICTIISWLLVIPASSHGQRIHFPSAIPTNTAPALSGAGASAPMAVNPVSQVQPGAIGGARPLYGTPAAQSGMPTYYPPGASTVYPPGTSTAYPPGVTPPYAPGATATLQGNIQPPSMWDPYATPGCQSQGLLPQDPCLPSSQAMTFPTPSGTIAKVKRFFQGASMEYVWMPGNGPQELGINDVELSATFALPFFYNPDSPLYVTPGFAAHYWNGPSVALVPAPSDFPPRTYDAYLDAEWNPQINQVLGGELSFRVGVYSDFTKVVNESLRYQGRGVMVLSLSPNMQVKAGVEYLDRQRIKLFPVGGLVWSPSPDYRFEIVFPDPKLAVRLQSFGNTDWWLFFRGEYGGGSWTIKGVAPGETDLLAQRDYNDTRAAVGVEFDSASRADGFFEVGVAFEREIYGDGIRIRTPNPTVFAGAGLHY